MHRKGGGRVGLAAPAWQAVRRSRSRLPQARSGNACGADFLVCRCAGFPIGGTWYHPAGWAMPTPGRLKVGETAGWKACATACFGWELETALRHQNRRAPEALPMGWRLGQCEAQPEQPLSRLAGSQLRLQASALFRTSGFGFRICRLLLPLKTALKPSVGSATGLRYAERAPRC